jgi:hypothetical protein
MHKNSLKVPLQQQNNIMNGNHSVDLTSNDKYLSKGRIRSSTFDSPAIVNNTTNTSNSTALSYMSKQQQGMLAGKGKSLKLDIMGKISSMDNLNLIENSSNNVYHLNQSNANYGPINGAKMKGSTQNLLVSNTNTPSPTNPNPNLKSKLFVTNSDPTSSTSNLNQSSPAVPSNNNHVLNGQYDKSCASTSSASSSLPDEDLDDSESTNNENKKPPVYTNSSKIKQNVM